MLVQVIIKFVSGNYCLESLECEIKKKAYKKSIRNFIENGPGRLNIKTYSENK